MEHLLILFTPLRYGQMTEFHQSTSTMILVCVASAKRKRKGGRSGWWMREIRKRKNGEEGSERKGALATKARFTLCRSHSKIASSCHFGTYNSSQVNKGWVKTNLHGKFLKYKTDHLGVEGKCIPFNLSSYLETNQTWWQ